MELPTASGSETDDRLMVVGYMDMVDWEHELGEASGGVLIHPSVEDLKRERTCWSQCGIVRVEVRIVGIEADQNFSRA